MGMFFLVLATIITIVIVAGWGNSMRPSNMHGKVKLGVGHSPEVTKRIHEAAKDNIRKAWMPRINKQERKAARHTVKASRVMGRGRNPARHVWQAEKHGSVADGLRGFMNREIGFYDRRTSMLEDKKTRDKAGFGSVGSTGQVTGGFGRQGHRASDQRIRQAPNRKVKPETTRSSFWKDTIVGDIHKKGNKK